MKIVKSKKILHVITISFVIKHFFGKQFKYLNSKTGNRYYLACSKSDELKMWSEEFGYTPFEVEITRSISPLKDLISIYKLVKYIKREKFDYVVAHTPKGGLVGMIAAFISGVPNRIYFRHGVAYETSHGMKRMLLINIERISGFLAHKIVNVSYGVQKISIADKLNNPDKNLILKKGTCNGIDALGRFNPDNINRQEVFNLKNKFSIFEDDFVIGYVGRLVHDKGIDELIEAWQMVRNNPRLKLLLVGPFEERDRVKESTKDRILNDKRIIFLDYVADASIYFSLMDVFVLATYREGFPTVALEASSMKVPVIISRATGCEEAILENKTGIFVNNNPNDISEAILQYYNNKQLCEEHGVNGRDFVLHNFEEKLIWDSINSNLGY